MRTSLFSIFLLISACTFGCTAANVQGLPVDVPAPDAAVSLDLREPSQDAAPMADGVLADAAPIPDDLTFLPDLVPPPDLAPAPDLLPRCPNVPNMTEADVPWVAPDVFFDGREYAYAAFDMPGPGPSVTGGANIRIASYPGMFPQVMPTTYIVYSTGPIQALTMGRATRKSFDVRMGRLLRKGVWNAMPQDTVSLAATNQPMTIIAVSLTEISRSSMWFGKVDGSRIDFSCDTPIHYLKVSATPFQAHSLLGGAFAGPNAQGGAFGIEWSLYGSGF